MAPLLDLNADLGEGAPDDAALLSLVTSANIACGLHAGDAATMRRTVELCLQHGVGIGAHPGYPDREGFGRRPLPGTTPWDVEQLVLYQVGALQAIARAAGGRVGHVKVHGALYHDAAVQPAVAQAVARAVQAAGPDLVWLVPPGSAMARAGAELGLPLRFEAFADRAYTDAGQLVPRDQPGAVLHDADVVAARVLELVRTGEIASIGGRRLTLRADSVCVHGDHPDALALARALRQRLSAAGIVLRPLAVA